MQLNRLTQEQLLERIYANDSKVIEYAYKKMYPSISRYILANNGSAEEARDIYQEAFFILFQKIQKGNFQLTVKLETFLFGIAKKLWLKQLRNNKYLPQVYLSLLGDKELLDSIEQEADLEIVEYELALALDELRERCRKLLIYFYYEKKSLWKFIRLSVWARKLAQKTKK
jgi:RNA polymerase sigma factor (sigma-70 family)